MNREDIIRMARKAGFVLDDKANDEAIERFAGFAALVAAFEREACAKVCEDRDSGQRLPIDEEDHECAAAIRARGNK